MLEKKITYTDFNGIERTETFRVHLSKAEILETKQTDYSYISTKMCKEKEKNTMNIVSLEYKKVIFNKPATIVLWKDGTKTVVTCGPNDIYDPEKGLALCYMKKVFGNKSGPLNKVLKRNVEDRTYDLSSMSLECLIALRDTINEQINIKTEEG